MLFPEFHQSGVSLLWELPMLYRRKPLLVCRLPASIARVFRVPRNLSSISYHGFIIYAINRECVDFPSVRRFPPNEERAKNGFQEFAPTRRKESWRNTFKKQQIEQDIWANGTLTSLGGCSCFVVARYRVGKSLFESSNDTPNIFHVLAIAK